VLVCEGIRILVIQAHSPWVFHKRTQKRLVLPVPLAASKKYSLAISGIS